MTKIGKTLAAGFTICSAMLLTGCGGGSVGVSADITIPVTQTPAFEIGAQLNGLPIGNFDVEPGDNQTITVPVGATFELDSNADVYWAVYVGGNLINGGSNAITFENATLTETLTNGVQFAGYATSQGPLSQPVPFTLIATSKIDGSQTAQINVVVTD
jgi:hypothetical protein